MGSTILQLFALVLRIISLIFETIGWLFRTGSAMLMNVSSTLLAKVGFMKTQAIQEETTT
jgi:hypothetical protein